MISKLNVNNKQMFVVYEDTLLNKLILTFTELGFISEERLISFEDVETEPFEFFTNLQTRMHDDPELLFLCSTTILSKRLEEIIDKVPKSIDLVVSIKDFEEVNKELINTKTTSWRHYWLSATNTLKKEGCPKEVFESVMAYQRGIANLAQRRMYVALKKASTGSKHSFVNFVRTSATDVVHLTKIGKDELYKLESQIQKDKNTTLDKTINDKRYSIVVSNILESAFQIFEMAGGNTIVLLCQINLAKRNVIVHILSKVENEETILEDNVLTKDGRFQRAILSLEDFISKVVDR